MPSKSALAFANLRSLAARHRLDVVPDWEPGVTRKFGGYQDAEEYLQLCVVEARQPCSMVAGPVESQIRLLQGVPPAREYERNRGLV